MDYTSRYGMDFNPFIKNSKEIVVETSDYKEVLYRLNYLLDNKGFGILTGGPGRGKTYQKWHKVWRPNSSCWNVHGVWRFFDLSRRKPIS